MREIKFRAWDRELKKMMYGILEDSDDAMLIRFDHFEDENPVFLQYTGLKDKNGLEIYEGDVVEQTYEKVIHIEYDPETLGFVDSEDVSGHHIGEVVITATKGACLRNPIRYDDGDEEPEKTMMYKPIAGYRCKVIGNVHDNPDLLEVNHAE